MDQSVQKSLEEFFAVFKLIRYGAREVILRQDDIPQGIEFIQSGYVRMYRMFENGTELSLNVFKPGSFFPVVWAICDLPNPYYFKTLTETVVWRAPKEEAVKFLKQNPEVLYELTKRLLSGNYGLLLHTEKLLTGSAYQKVVSVLMMLVKRFGKPDGKARVITLRFSHQDIADFAYLSRETTCIQMKNLKDEGLISYTGQQITVLDPMELEKRLSSK